MIAQANSEEPVLAGTRSRIRAQILAARPLVHGALEKLQAYNRQADAVFSGNAAMTPMPASGDDAAMQQTCLTPDEYRGKKRQTRLEALI
jgi:hypothetical protein